MSDWRPYGDDPSSYSYISDYFSNPSSPDDCVNDPGMSSGCNNSSYSTSTDNNPYSGNPCWGSAYPNQTILNFDNNTYQPTANVGPYFSFQNSGMAATYNHNNYLANTSGYPPQSDIWGDGEVEVHPHYSTNSEDDSVDSDDSPVRLQRCNTIAKQKKSKSKECQQWLASWCKGTGIPPKTGQFCLDYYVSTDGYFRAGRIGGHGVIIRDNGGKPVVASAFTSTEAKSYLYHHVKALALGVELAVNYSLLDIQLFCNEKHVARLVNSAIRSSADVCEHGRKYFDVICKRCMRHRTKSDHESVFPLLKYIAETLPKFLVPVHVVKVPRDFNRAADYLAKNGAPGMEVLSPSGLPDELKEILCEDYESESYGLPVCPA